MDTNDSDSDRKEYLKTREGYINVKHQQIDQFDKYMLTLSSGSFALTFAFIDNVVKGNYNCKQFLLCGWIMFALTILSVLISFVISQLAHSKAIKEIDECYTNDNHVFQESILNYCTKILNWYSLGFFILGIINILIFVSINI